MTELHCPIDSLLCPRVVHRVPVRHEPPLPEREVDELQLPRRRSAFLARQPVAVRPAVAVLMRQLRHLRRRHAASERVDVRLLRRPFTTAGEHSRNEYQCGGRPKCMGFHRTDVKLAQPAKRRDSASWTPRVTDRKRKVLIGTPGRSTRKQHRRRRRSVIQSLPDVRTTRGHYDPRSRRSGRADVLL